ncbi:MAG TPA: hypothetical protein VJU84_02205 [Pyrinomonadaceae bacterium]|nr:hypothetical protein [Pyrinomonadaceae bacterium]
MIVIFGRVHYVNDESFATIGEWRRGYVAAASAKRNENSPHRSKNRELNEAETQRLSLRELEEDYEPLRKRQPNFVDFGNGYVPAHDDDNGVIVIGTSVEEESFHVLVRSYGNEHASKPVKSLQKVSLRLTFACFDRTTGTKPQRIVIHRGGWLSELETEIDFPAGCPPRRAVIVTAEGTDNSVYAVRRDSDSSYKGILPLREPLTGSVYGVLLNLLAASQTVATFNYILEVIRDPGFELRLTNAAIWKGEHLYKFAEEGTAFSQTLNEIWRDVQSQFPYPEIKPINNFFAPRDAFDYSENASRIRAAEREQEGKILEGIKDWEARAADFLTLYISADQGEKFLKTLPSIDDGFNRVQKRLHGLRLSFIRGQNQPAPPSLPYWDLSGAVSSRTDKLMKIIREI